ncbi:MAG: DUF1801 domain-containing protein [Bacteroidia bacterium]|nr:DUF1801 domain-containing protein [Bacteroidia bacterium]
MAKNKTTETQQSAVDFIESINDETKRNDCLELIRIIKELINLEPKLWGTSIIGFGTYHYKYNSGHEGDSPIFSFAPSASSIALYLSANFENRVELLQQLGKHKTTKGCVHIKTLADVDITVLQKIIMNHIKHIRELYLAK